MSYQRTNIEIDPKKLEKVKKISGLKTAKEAVDYALGKIATSNQAWKGILNLRGKIKFEEGYDYKKGRR